MKHLFLFTLILTLCFSCAYDDSASLDSNGNTQGVAGSLARFVIDGDYLYMVDDTKLSIFNAANPSTLQYVGEKELGWGIETIYPYQNYLFFGTNSGMLIYDKSNQEDPQYISSYQHIVSCDPVTVKGNHAYLTLRAQGFEGERNPCTRGVSELQVIDISNINAPYQVNGYELANPIGLTTKNDDLFVCDNRTGLHHYDISASPALTLLKVYEEVKGHDLIIYGDLVMVISTDKLQQFRYQNGQLNALGSIILS